MMLQLRTQILILVMMLSFRSSVFCELSNSRLMFSEDIL
jgi:hypothetical protein